MKTVSAIVIAFGLILGGTSAQAGTDVNPTTTERSSAALRFSEKWNTQKTNRTDGDGVKPELDAVVADPGPMKGATCEEQVEALKAKAISLQCELEKLKCLEAGGTQEECHSKMTCLELSEPQSEVPDRWNTQSTENGDSPVDWGNADNDDASSIVATKVDKDQIRNPGALKAAVCEAYLDLLEKTIQSLQGAIDDLNN